MKTSYKLITLLFVTLLFSPYLLFAATNDFTADADITVSNVIMGAGSVDMLILDTSTAESWAFNSGTFTVTNPGTFLVGSSDSTVKIFNVNLGVSLVECAENTTPGTSSVTIPTTAGTYTIEPSTTTSCSSNLCSAVSNAASLNSYPTCGAASCNAGYRLSGSGAGATCVSVGGGGLAPAPTVGAGTGTSNIGVGETFSVGTVSSGGINILMYIDSQALFDVVTSSGSSSGHSATISDLDLVNKKVTIILQSNPVAITLNIGESKLVDLDDDNIKDVKVTFSNLVINRVEVTITSLSEGSTISAPETDESFVSSYSFNRDLELGMKGEDVQNLQEYLNDFGFTVSLVGPGSKGNETTYFGELTQAALIEFQKANSITPAVGYFGPITREVINSSNTQSSNISYSISDIEPFWLVKSNKFVEVFFVSKEITLRWVINEQVAEKHFGPTWNQVIKEFDDLGVAGIPFGDNLE